MESTNEQALSLPASGVGRLVATAKAGLAVIGLAVVLAALLGFALPEPREALLRPLLSQLGGWTAPWDMQQGNVSAGTIQTGDATEAREQRAVADFIAKRYRVANDAVSGFVATAYRAGTEWKVDPLLILAVMAVESRYNPVAESNLGAKGLMQVIPKFHQDKLQDLGGDTSLLDPQTNIQVGAQILREYMRRFGETETALQMYAGAFDEPNSQYAFKVLAERARLEQVSKQARRASA